jgi:K+-sensing histidine kinase KdpD
MIQKALPGMMTAMSLEVRTRTQLLVGISDLLLCDKAGPLNEEQRKMMLLIKKSGGFLNSAWNDLLDSYNVLTYDIDLSLEETNLAQLIEKTIEIAFDSWALDHVSERPHIVMDIPSRLPLVPADQYYLQLAVTRLILMIVGYGHENNIKMTITATFNEVWATINLTATGGMPFSFWEEYNIWLISSRVIIEKHGGNVGDLSNDVEKKAYSVSFTLPLTHPSKAQSS